MDQPRGACLDCEFLPPLPCYLAFAGLPFFLAIDFLYWLPYFSISLSTVPLLMSSSSYLLDRKSTV